MTTTPNKNRWAWIALAVILVAGLLFVLAVIGLMVIQVMISPAQ